MFTAAGKKYDSAADRTLSCDGCRNLSCVSRHIGIHPRSTLVHVFNSLRVDHGRMDSYRREIFLTS